MRAQDRIKQVHADILRHKTWCAVSGLLACGKSEIDNTIPTACTDGWNRKYNADFVESLTREELRFVVLHEVAGHMAYQHMRVWRTLWEKNAKLTNLAADHFVNLALMDSDGGEGFIRMPAMGVQPDAQFRGMSVGQIYQLLEEQVQNEAKGFDEHEWEDAPNEETSNVRSLEIERAMRQGEILRRARGNKGDTPFGDLLSAKVDWRKQLRDFLSTHQGHDESTWSRVSRRHITSGDYMPGTYGVRMGEVVLGVDTSGSCVGETMTTFVSELNALVEELKPEKVHVVYWDTSVTGHQVYEGVFNVHSLTPTGGGGTNGAVLFDYLREKGMNPQCVVQFSDGEVGEWGYSDWPTLWALTGNHVSPHGVTVRIDK